MKRIWVEMQNPVFTHQKQVINRLLKSSENCQIEMLVFMQYLWTGVHYGVMMTLCKLRTHYTQPSRCCIPNSYYVVVRLMQFNI